MKYSELLSFNPIEDVIQLTTANNADKAREYVESYVMSDTMADNLKATVIDQLQMDEVIDNKGILVVGNYGTGKSHLMSVISAVANNADYLQYLRNQRFAMHMEQVAGKFEVLRIEIGGVTMSLRDIIFGFIQEDFAKRQIDFQAPDFSRVKDNKEEIKNMMIAFGSKYPDKGYLIVVDEFLSYLSSRNEREIVLDLEFLRALGEMCSKSKLRIIFGVQEQLFDNPRFSFVSDTLMHVKDRFTQLIITKDATSYVVSERILKKTPEQRALIRVHLEKFSNLYSGMSSRMEEYVDLFPIHPAYIEVFNKLYLGENRHILKNISLTIKDLFDREVPKTAPGIVSFDDYWPSIKSDGLLRSDPTISRVLDASQQLEDIVKRAYTRPQYQSMAIQIIYALSVHRLTTNGLDVKFGMTAENLKDDLCLYIETPERDSDFLLGIVRATLKEIMKTVNGQFIIFNEGNGQYYIDVNKVIDYDERVRQRASLLVDDDRNRYFYKVVYNCLEWDQKQYVPGFEIYEHDLNWDSHNIFREGYLFMGLPGERSTAQPERDFYMHIMPPYGDNRVSRNDVEDEVYFYFKSTDEFYEMISHYAAASILAGASEGNDKDAYSTKADSLRKRLVRFLSENKNTCFDIVYKSERHQLIEILRGRYKQDDTFNNTIDLAASILLDDYFMSIYPEYPVMRTKITRKNMAENAKAAFEHFGGRKTQQSTLMLQSFELLDGDKISPEGSKYASYYIGLIRNLSPRAVLNYSDLFDEQGNIWKIDKKFRIWHIFTPIIFLSLVYAGYIEITLTSNEKITASNLENVIKLSPSELYEFKYLSRPDQISMAELKKLFEILGLNPAKLTNQKQRDVAVEDLVRRAQELSGNAAKSAHELANSFELWGEPLVNEQCLQQLKKACTSVKEEFTNYSSKFNTPAKLNNFKLDFAEIKKLENDIHLVQLVPKYMSFKANCVDIVSYISSIENVNLGESMKDEIIQAKLVFREVRDQIWNGYDSDTASGKVLEALERIKEKYIDIYYQEHGKKRLGYEEAKRKGRLQEDLKFKNLRKLSTIDILSSPKFTDIERSLTSLAVCYTLTPADLKSKSVCPHCNLKLDNESKSVHGQLGYIEDRIDSLLDEWTKILLEAIQDPIVMSQKQYMPKDQIKVIEDFFESQSLPEHVDDFFINSIQAILKGYQPVVISVEDLVQQLENLPPVDEATFKSKLNEIISDYTRGKDTSSLRIIVKRNEHRS